MNILTHIPEANTFGIVTFITLVCGSFSISDLIHRQWLRQKGVRISKISAWTKGILTLYGFLLIPMPSFLSLSIIKLGIGILIGLVIGWLYLRIEKWLPKSRLLARLLIDSTPHHSFWRKESTISTKQPIKYTLSSRPLTHVASSNSTISSHEKLHALYNSYRYGLISIVLCACFEEIIFRGFFVTIALNLTQSWMTISMFIFTTLVFGISHLYGGIYEIVPKTILGILALASVLITGTILPAIIAHICINVYAHKKSDGHLYNVTKQDINYRILNKLKY